jgi:signal transduction histidine kinase
MPDPLKSPFPKPFWQPLALTLVSLLFISLLLLMGFLNLEAVDQSMVRLITNSAISLIKNIEKNARSSFEDLIAKQSSDITPSAEEEEDSLQEAFLIELTNLAQALDKQWSNGKLTPAAADAWMKKEGIAQALILDRQGHYLLQTSPAPTQVMTQTQPVIAGQEDFKIHIFSFAREGGADHGFIALRRNSGAGTIVLILDRVGWYQRCAKFAIEKVFFELERPANIAYCLMRDSGGDQIIFSQIDAIPPYGGQGFLKIFSYPGNVKARKFSDQQRDYLDIVMPINLGHDALLLLRIGLITDQIRLISHQHKRNIFIAISFLTLIALLAVGLLSWNQKRYIQHIRAMEQRIHQAERLSAVGRLAAGMAHEIRNPLNAISMAIQRLHREQPHQLTAIIRADINRLNQIIEEFLTISRSHQLKFQNIPLLELLKPLLLLIEAEAEAKSISIKTDWPEPNLSAEVDADRIRQAVINLAKNALEASVEPGSITFGLKTAPDGRISIKVSDTGKGIAAKDMAHIFDPDFTTKEKGLGLGLALVYEIVAGHGGEILVSSQPGQGSTFEILLPPKRI